MHYGLRAALKGVMKSKLVHKNMYPFEQIDAPRLRAHILVVVAGKWYASRQHPLRHLNVPHARNQGFNSYQKRDIV